MRGEHPVMAGDNAVLFVDQHRVGEAKFADRGGDLRDLLVAVRARVSGIGDQRRAGARLRRHLPFPFRYPVAHEDAPITPLGSPAGGGVKRWCRQSLAGAQAKAGVMPGQRTVSSTISPSPSGPP